MGVYLFSEEFGDEGDEVLGLGAPGLEAAEAFLEFWRELAVLPGLGINASEAFFAGFEVRDDLFVEEAGDEAAELGFGLVVVAAVAGDENGFDGAEALEGAEGLGGGALGDAKGLLDGVEGEGFLSSIKEAVDLSDAFGDAEEGGGANKELDGLELPGRKNGSFSAVVRRGAGGGMGGGGQGTGDRGQGASAFFLIRRDAAGSLLGFEGREAGIKVGRY